MISTLFWTFILACRPFHQKHTIKARATFVTYREFLRQLSYIGSISEPHYTGNTAAIIISLGLSTSIFLESQYSTSSKNKSLQSATKGCKD